MIRIIVTKQPDNFKKVLIPTLRLQQPGDDIFHNHFSPAHYRSRLLVHAVIYPPLPRYISLYAAKFLGVFPEVLQWKDADTLVSPEWADHSVAREQLLISPRVELR